MPAFWHWFIAGGTILFIIWCIWLISWSSKQGPANVADDEVVGHKWDGDLEEWNNPAPKWWLYLYFITIAWAIGYLVFYPGIGIFDGVADWTSEGQYEQEMQRAEERYAPIYEKFSAMDFDALVQDEEALSLGRSLYASYCTSCHGSGGYSAPPVDTRLETDTTEPGVGAHRAHVEAADWHAVIPCDECHQVPFSLDDPGHVDTALPAELVWGDLAAADGADNVIFESLTVDEVRAAIPPATCFKRPLTTSW